MKKKKSSWTKGKKNTFVTQLKLGYLQEHEMNYKEPDIERSYGRLNFLASWHNDNLQYIKWNIWNLWNNIFKPGSLHSKKLKNQRKILPRYTAALIFSSTIVDVKKKSKKKKANGLNISVAFSCQNGWLMNFNMLVVFKWYLELYFEMWKYTQVCLNWNLFVAKKQDKTSELCERDLPWLFSN